jgi:cytochrome c biogenesis protein ResB
MRRLMGYVGSLTIAVPLLIAIAAVLGWGTIYETRFGTAAVQRAVYQSWWFQALLAFLAVNLAIAVLERYPWRQKHVPFVLAHLGIILTLLGGIIGARFGVEGHLVIPEGQAEQALQLPAKVLEIYEPNPGIRHLVPTHFEASAWIHEPNARFLVPLKDRGLIAA